MSETIKVKDLISKLQLLYPEDAAEEWDNPGLLVGHFDAEVSRIFVTLDVSDEALKEATAWNADLIISHHPLIFGSRKQINDADLTGRRILSLAEQRIACYAMHTNYDVCRMAELNASQLNLSDQEVLFETGEQNGIPAGIGRVGNLPEAMTLEDTARYVKERMGIPEVIVYGDAGTEVRRAAVSGGSGPSVVGSAAAKKAQVLITGDMDYHTATDAVAGGMCVIDAGHYGTEYCFIRDVAEQLRKEVPFCEIREAAVRHPYYVI